MKRIAGLLVVLLAFVAGVGHAQDTTYTLGPDQGSAIGIYPHYYQLTRGDSTLGIVLQGNASAGSCANVWCALVPSNASNGYGQSGGTFTSRSDAAHEVVRVWNSLHPGSVLPLTVDSSYTTTRVSCPAGKWLTCYNIRQNGNLAGWVWQKDTSATRRWVPGRGTTPLPGLYETTLRAAAIRVVLSYMPGKDSTLCTPDTVIRVDTVIRHDTVIVKVPVIVHDTVFAPAGTPELPRNMQAMNDMVAASRAADNTIRQVYNQAPGGGLVAATDSLGRPVCDKGGVRMQCPVGFPLGKRLIKPPRAVKKSPPKKAPLVNPIGEDNA